MPASPAMPTPTSTPLTLLTFNVLAPCYKRLHTPSGAERRDRERHHESLWTGRLERLTDLLLSISPRPDVIALQEVWFCPPFLARLEAALSPLYAFHYAKRPGKKEDGLATLVLRASPSIRSAKKVASFALADADRVGLAVSVRLDSGAELLVVNAHLTFPHCFISRMTRAEQAGTLVSYVSSYMDSRRNDVHAVVLGDFNGDGDSLACKRMAAGGFVNCYAKVNGPDAHPSTHLNHMRQQVFVDHVFLKSSFGPASRDAAPTQNWLPAQRRRRRVSALREEEPVVRDASADGTRRSRHPTSQPRSISPSPVAIRDMNKSTAWTVNRDNSPLEKPCLFSPVATTVYPERYTTDVWPSEFDLSDHRPLAVQFRYGSGAAL